MLLVILLHSQKDEDILRLIKEKEIPYIICYNKCDLKEISQLSENEICVSGVTGKNIYELNELIGKKIKKEPEKKI